MHNFNHQSSSAQPGSSTPGGAASAPETATTSSADPSPVIVARLDREYRYTCVSDAFAARFGRRPEEILGHTPAYLLGPELFAAVRPRMDACLQGQELAWDTEHVYPALGKRDVRVLYTPDRDKDGRITGIIAVVQDLTRTNRAEAELDHANLHLVSVLESLGDGFVSIDPNWRYTYVNAAAEKLLRTDRAQMLGRDMRELFPLAELFHEQFTRALAFQSPVQFKRFYDPLQMWMEVRAFSSPAGLSILFRDVTERQRIENALSESEERFRALADNIAQLAWIANGDGWIFWYNRRWYEYTGTTLEEMQGWGWASVHHPDHLDRVVTRWSRHLEAGEFWEDTFPLKSKEGEYRRFLSRAFPIRDEAGTVVRWCGTNTDVEELKRAEEAIQGHVKEIEALNERLRRSMTETHHRVRNNLQILSAMIDLQSDGAGALVSSSELTRLSRHIHALATIHDILTEQSKSDEALSFIPVRKSLEKLFPLLRQLSDDISLEFYLDDFRLPIRPATSLAIVMSELVCNAIKHGRSRVRVSVSAARGEGRLTVCDDGGGFPMDFDVRNMGRTGLELVTHLAAWDLSGVVRFENGSEGGGRVVVTFPVPEEQQALRDGGAG